MLSAEPPQSEPSQRKVPLVVSWGELVWDFLPDGRRLGGAAANVAYQVAALGVDAVLLSAVGTDRLGDEALACLERAGVDTRWVQRDPLRPTGTVDVELRGGQPVYAIATNVAWDAIPWRDELGAILAEAHVFTYGTLAQRTAEGQKALQQTLAALPKGTVRTCDLNLRPPFVTRSTVMAALAAADVVKLNLDECAVLTERFGISGRPPAARRTNSPEAGELGPSESSSGLADAVAAWLFDRFDAKLVVVTRGAGGSVLYTEAERCAHPGISRNTDGGDPVGAGDAFLATVAVELAHLRRVPVGAELWVMSERANERASETAALRGAMPTD